MRPAQSPSMHREATSTAGTFRCRRCLPLLSVQTSLVAAKDHTMAVLSLELSTSTPALSQLCSAMHVTPASVQGAGQSTASSQPQRAQQAEERQPGLCRAACSLARAGLVGPRHGLPGRAVPCQVRPHCTLRAADRPRHCKAESVRAEHRRTGLTLECLGSATGLLALLTLWRC